MKTSRKISPKVWAAIAVDVLIVAAVIGFAVHNKLSASTMNLMKTEGTVRVSNEKGTSVAPKENLKLYSGYGVDTKPVSYAWINLDDVKLVKMDEDSEIEVQKDGKQLEILVNSGSLFFNVKQPLAGDEAMMIRTSSMVVGIRGTCGWVESDEDQGAKVFILEGTVEAEAIDTGRTVQVSAGEMAEVTVNEDGKTEIEVLAFIEEYISPFVLTELKDDPTLSAAILKASGLDVLNPPTPEDRLRDAFLEVMSKDSSRPVFAKLTGKGENMALYLLDIFDRTLCKYTRNGTELQADYLDTNIAYAKLIDMDQDGSDELLLVTGDWKDNAVVYSWNQTGAERKSLDIYNYFGEPILYRDKASGTVYLRSRSVAPDAQVEYFSSLTDCVVLEWEGTQYREEALQNASPAERAEIEASMAASGQRWNEFQAQLDAQLADLAFIETIDTSGSSPKIFSAMEYTVEEVQQQLRQDSK